ncbi:MAG TPA: hypothetical protein VEK57_02430 [Thermoanaerobaculia bacterium]|nr:hypothetical protein [Thermoanaerobaculia bacterium]
MIRNLFRRKKTLPVPPVSLTDGARARQFLQQQTSFDIDEFLASQTADELFNCPLGWTADCLSVNQVAELVEGRRIEPVARRHAALCDECRQALRAYESLKNTHWANDLMIVASHRIRIPEEGPRYLVLTNRGQSGTLEQILPESVTVEGAILASGCVIRPSARRYDGFETVELHFKQFELNAPSDVKEICDWVSVEAKTRGGKLRKREFVRVFRESYG